MVQFKSYREHAWKMRLEREHASAVGGGARRLLPGATAKVESDNDWFAAQAEALAKRTGRTRFTLGEIQSGNVRK